MKYKWGQDLVNNLDKNTASHGDDIWQSPGIGIILKDKTEDKPPIWT